MPRSMPLSSSTPLATGRTTPTTFADDPVIDAVAVADYIADLSSQLAVMASDADLDLLAYLLEMVQIEAVHIKRRAETTDPGRPDKDR